MIKRVKHIKSNIPSFKKDFLWSCSKNKRNSNIFIKSQLGGYLRSSTYVLQNQRNLWKMIFDVLIRKKNRKIENFIFCKEHQIPSHILKHFQQSQQLCLLVYLLIVFEKNNLSGSRIHENSNKRRFKSISHLVRNEMNQHFSKTGMICECFGRNQSF